MPTHKLFGNSKPRPLDRYALAEPITIESYKQVSEPSAGSEAILYREEVRLGCSFMTLPGASLEYAPENVRKQLLRAVYGETEDALRALHYSIGDVKRLFPKLGERMEQEINKAFDTMRLNPEEIE